MPLLPISTSTGSIIGIVTGVGHRLLATNMDLRLSYHCFLEMALGASDLHHLPTWDPSIVLIWAFSAANGVFNLLVVYFNMIKS